MNGPERLDSKKTVSHDLKEYVEREIIPRYDHFDKGHGRDHVRTVIEQSLHLARNVSDISVDMVYCIAAFHDLGLVNGREYHHIDSGKILESDPFVARFFNEGEIRQMKEAVEDHRASAKSEPRSIFGKIVADADRFIDPATIMRRAIQYGLANYPHLDRQGHYDRVVSHLKNKYGPNGYIRLWLPWGDNAARLQNLHEIIADQQRMKRMFFKIFKDEMV